MSTLLLSYKLNSKRSPSSFPIPLISLHNSFLLFPLLTNIYLVCSCCCRCRSKSGRCDDKASRSPELDAMVKRQLYEQRAAWNAAHPECLYAPDLPPPPAAAIVDSEKKRMGHSPSQWHSIKDSELDMQQMWIAPSSPPPPSYSQIWTMPMPMPVHVHMQSGSGPVMMMN